MPWRKKWIDPRMYEGKDKELGSLLARRAYEVWVSEVSKFAPFPESAENDASSRGPCDAPFFLPLR